jgi:hypothetical protein
MSEVTAITTMLVRLVFTDNTARYMITIKPIPGYPPTAFALTGCPSVVDVHQNCGAHSFFPQVTASETNDESFFVNESQSSATR